MAPWTKTIFIYTISCTPFTTSVQTFRLWCTREKINQTKKLVTFSTRVIIRNSQFNSIFTIHDHGISMNTHLSLKVRLLKFAKWPFGEFNGLTGWWEIQFCPFQLFHRLFEYFYNIIIIITKVKVQFRLRKTEKERKNTKNQIF